MKLHQPLPESPIQPTPQSTVPETTPVTSNPPPKKRRAPRTCWAEPTLWAILTAAARRTGFSSPQAIVNEVQRGPNGALFKTLDRGTVGAWINWEHTGWTQEALERASRAATALKLREAPRLAREGAKLGRPHSLVSSTWINIYNLTLISHIGSFSRPY